MNRRSVFFALAAGVLVLGLGASDARAGFVPLPTTYDKLIGNFTTVDGRPTGELLTFSGFTFSSSSTPAGSEVDPKNIPVTAYTVGNETGFSFGGAGLFAPANTRVDVAITYVVTAPAGEKLTDAFLNTVGGNFGGTGTYSVNETLVDAGTLKPIGVLAASSPPGLPSDLINFAGVQSIIVSKDIILVGGTQGESLSIVTQAFSSEGTVVGVPEPASLALLGIGMTGLLAFRRFFKKASAA